MARRSNSLFLGAEYLNIEGRSIKHPGLLKVYANPNINKITDKPIDLLGIDIETEATTGELRLLGFWDGQEYRYVTSGFLDMLYMLVKKCKHRELTIAHWNRLDPFIMFKQFLSLLPDSDIQTAMERYGHISGEYDNKLKQWKISPVVMVTMPDGNQFGIAQAIRSSIQFFYNAPDETPNKVWAYDIAQLFENGLEKEATERLGYYSKVDKSAHIVDWKRFASDATYRNDIVLKSNEYDARAVYDLGYAIQKDFYNAFGFYARTLISQGSLARAATVADLYNTYSPTITNKTELDEKIATEINSIGIMSYLDEWADTIGDDLTKDLYCLLTESYSGGYIEAIRYGYTDSAWYADIASAYPGVIQHLYDLRGAVITHGFGEPPHTEHSYVFIRGTVHIPANLQFNPITVKHPIFRETNIRASGEYKASYTIEERDYIINNGGSFTDESWYHIQTTGNLSPLAKVCVNFVELRKKFKAMKSSSQYMAKIASNSLYGILYEAVPMYSETVDEKEIIVKHENEFKPLLKRYLKSLDLTSVKSDLIYVYGKEGYRKVWQRWHKHGGQSIDSVVNELIDNGCPIHATTTAEMVQEIEHIYTYESIEKIPYEVVNVQTDGYRAGEFWNPLYASIITARTRVLMAKAATAIEKNKGNVIIMMTDSILWNGRFEDMPNDLWREKKTLGYFEKPAQVHDIVALGSGRYGFTDEDGDKTAKRRGLNASEIQDENGIPLDSFDWMSALKIMAVTNKEKIDIKVRTLVSPGMVLGSHEWSWKDMGRVVEQNREVDAIVGRSKRWMQDDAVKNPKRLATELVDTTSIVISEGMVYDKEGIVDLTLPQLRKLTLAQPLTSRAEHKQTQTNERQSKHYGANKERYKRVYDDLRLQGFSREQAKTMCRWSEERLKAVPLPA